MTEQPQTTAHSTELADRLPDILAKVNTRLVSIDRQCDHLLAHAYNQPERPYSTAAMLSALTDMSHHADGLSDTLQTLRATVANQLTYCVIELADQARSSLQALRQIVEQDHARLIFSDNVFSSPHAEQVELLLTHITDYLSHIRRVLA